MRKSAVDCFLNADSARHLSGTSESAEDQPVGCWANMLPLSLVLGKETPRVQHSLQNVWGLQPVLYHMSLCYGILRRFLENTISMSTPAVESASFPFHAWTDYIEGEWRVVGGLPTLHPRWPHLPATTSPAQRSQSEQAAYSKDMLWNCNYGRFGDRVFLLSQEGIMRVTFGGEREQMEYMARVI